jgi:transcriptional regulator with XRE-family HTH domain
MNAKTIKTLKQLNDLYRICGTWQDVALEIGYNRATINKWFSGKRIPSHETRMWIAHRLGHLA